MDCSAVHIVNEWSELQCTLQLSVCWQERGGGTASGLSCCQLNTALIDDHADPRDDDPGDTGGGGDW